MVSYRKVVGIESDEENYARFSPLLQRRRALLCFTLLS